MQETMLMLATVARRYRLERVPGYPVEPEPVVRLCLKHGMKMFLYPSAKDRAK